MNASHIYDDHFMQFSAKGGAKAGREGPETIGKGQGSATTL